MATTETSTSEDESVTSITAARLPIRLRSGLFAALMLSVGMCLGYMTLRNDGGPPIDDRVALSPGQLPASSAIRRRPQPDRDGVARDGSLDGESLVAVEEKAGQVTLRELHLLDLLLTHGNVLRAMDSYSQLITGEDAVLNDQLVYRIAIAQELVGQLDNAGDLFRQLVAKTTEPRMLMAAQIGQARIWLKQGKLDLTRAAAAAAANSRSANESSSQLLKGDATHLLAHSHLPAATRDTDWPYGDDHFATAELRWSPTHLLDLARSAETPSSSGIVAEGLQLLYQYGEHPGEVQLRIQRDSVPLRNLVEEVAELTGHANSWSEAAMRAADGHVVSIRQENVSLAIALDQMMATVGLGWDFADGQVSIFSQDDNLTADVLRRIQITAADRLLRYAVANHGDNPLAVYSELAIGNVRFESGADAEAVVDFSRVRQRYPNSTTLLLAQFNEAKSLNRLGRIDEAIAAYFRVGDGGQGHPLQSVGYALAGRLLLEEGRTASAIRPLIRGLSSQSSLSDQTAIPSLTLASAYTLAGNHHAAAQVLMEQREHIRGTTYESIADFLASFGRYQVAADDLQKTRRGRDVVRSVGNLTYSISIGDHLHIILGDAFSAVGLSSQMEAHYRRVLNTNVAPYVDRLIRHRLAEYYSEVGNIAEAKQVLESIVATAPHRSSVRAAIKLARLEFMDDSPEVCLELCRVLLDEEIPEEEKANVLRLMGEVYQSREQHYQAALCFAGMLPGEGQRIPASILDRGTVQP